MRRSLVRRAWSKQRQCRGRGCPWRQYAGSWEHCGAEAREMARTVSFSRLWKLDLIACKVKTLLHFRAKVLAGERSPFLSRLGEQPCFHRAAFPQLSVQCIGFPCHCFALMFSFKSWCKVGGGCKWLRVGRSSRNGVGMDYWTAVFCSLVRLERNSGVLGSLCEAAEWLLGALAPQLSFWKQKCQFLIHLISHRIIIIIGFA